jgi:aminopeptidase
MTTHAHALLEPDTLRRYTDVVVRSCIGLKQGDHLVILYAPPHRDVAIALAETAWRLGAATVQPLHVDDRFDKARLALAPTESLGFRGRWVQQLLRDSVGPDRAIAVVMGEEEPGLLADVPPERVGLETSRRAKQQSWFTRVQQQKRLRGCIFLWPTAAWATTAFPDDDEATAMRNLADDIVRFCRILPSDPPDAWDRHCDQLDLRKAAITARRFAALELRGPGTDLRVGLHPAGRWVAGRTTTPYGDSPSLNYPSEEVFTSPVASATEGTFRCTRPLSFQGRVLEGLRGEFRRGRLVRLDADDDDGRDVLAAALDTDRGGRRLGEVALVDGSGRIGQARRVYWNALLDENAASHMAFGSGFDDARDPGAGAPGVNRSATHVDVMIGSDELEVSGIEQGGARVPVIVGGEWLL